MKNAICYGRVVLKQPQQTADLVWVMHQVRLTLHTQAASAVDGLSLATVGPHVVITGCCGLIAEWLTKLGDMQAAWESYEVVIEPSGSKADDDDGWSEWFNEAVDLPHVNVVARVAQSRAEWDGIDSEAPSKPHWRHVLMVPKESVERVARLIQEQFKHIHGWYTSHVEQNIHEKPEPLRLVQVERLPGAVVLELDNSDVYQYALSDAMRAVLPRKLGVRYPRWE